jgi:hypothetical protein
VASRKSLTFLCFHLSNGADESISPTDLRLLGELLRWVKSSLKSTGGTWAMSGRGEQQQFISHIDSQSGGGGH